MNVDTMIEAIRADSQQVDAALDAILEADSAGLDALLEAVKKPDGALAALLEEVRQNEPARSVGQKSAQK